jgi:hypothetical protein
MKLSRLCLVIPAFFIANIALAASDYCKAPSVLPEQCTRCHGKPDASFSCNCPQDDGSFADVSINMRPPDHCYVKLRYIGGKLIGELPPKK